MALGIDQIPSGFQAIQNHSQKKPTRLKRTSQRERRIIQHKQELLETTRQQLSYSQHHIPPDITTQEQEEIDPFYYYDITSSSSSSSENESEYQYTYTHHPPNSHSPRTRKITFHSPSHEREEMPEVKEWQWVCCDCGKYNSLLAYETTTTGRERCQGKRLTSRKESGSDLCEHLICSECQDVETTVWRDEVVVEEKKG